MERLTKKYSTILIAAGGKTRVYHSVDDIPDELRDQLLNSTQGDNAATILIADSNGREEILKAVSESSPDRYSRLVAALMSGAIPPAPKRSRLRVALPLIGRALLVGCLAYVFWVLITLR